MGVAQGVKPKNLEKGKFKNVQFNIKIRNNKEVDNSMPRPRDIPKINSVVVTYNGDKKSFEIFMESMILDYLNSCSIAKSEPPEFVGKVENNMKSA